MGRGGVDWSHERRRSLHRFDMRLDEPDLFDQLGALIFLVFVGLALAGGVGLVLRIWGVL